MFEEDTSSRERRLAETKKEEACFMKRINGDGFWEALNGDLAVGAIVNFAVAFAVLKVTDPAPAHIQ